MHKVMIGPRLRQLRRERGQTQAEMAKAIGVSTAYINLLENNQRSLSVTLLMKLADTYHVDWREFTTDESSTLLAELRSIVRDPVFSPDPPDLQELRAAIAHAPTLVSQFVRLYAGHRTALEKIMRLGTERAGENLLASSPETIIHDFFRDHHNHFAPLEKAAEKLRTEEDCEPDELYSRLKARLLKRHGIKVRVTAIDDMSQSLRYYDRGGAVVHLSEALDHPNRVFQLAHVIGLVEQQATLVRLTRTIEIRSEAGIARCNAELANYFAAAVLMPYAPFYAAAERTSYDIDRLATAFGVSFEQVCQRLTTLQRSGAAGVPFFFLRIDRAGNVTKRFNSTSFHLAEYGGSCPVWKVHSAFFTPGQIMPQFVELPDGTRYFTICRTTNRPVFDRDTQDRRLAIALGCEARHASRIAYAAAYNLSDEQLFHPIGINCHVCPRKACSQRAHRPLFVELPIDANRRGNTRYES